MATQTTATAVSAKLRRAGFPTTPNYSRAGLRVSKSWRRGLVSVVVVQNSDRAADRMADQLAQELATWEGYKIGRNGGAGHVFSVEKIEEPTTTTEGQETEMTRTPASREWPKHFTHTLAVEIHADDEGTVEKIVIRNGASLLPATARELAREGYAAWTSSYSRGLALKLDTDPVRDAEDEGALVFTLTPEDQD